MTCNIYCLDWGFVWGGENLFNQTMIPVIMSSSSNPRSSSSTSSSSTNSSNNNGKIFLDRMSCPPRRSSQKDDLTRSTETGQFTAHVKRPVEGGSIPASPFSSPLASPPSSPVVITTPADPTLLPLFLFHHGAGLCGLSFDRAARELWNVMGGACGILAFDAQNHGYTDIMQGSNSQDEPWSLDSFAQDFIHVSVCAYPELADPTKRHFYPILVGHSLGGAVVSHVASLQSPQIGTHPVLGTVVIDVVEGTALDSLDHMQRIITKLPRSFDSMACAIDWAVRSNRVANRRSAEISIPPQLRQQNQSGPWVWRTDLMASAPYWKEWFTGLSAKFLSMKCARLLILAGTDRLDKELMIGQMQGKFQLVLYPESGHAIHEEVPEKVAESLRQFWIRHRPAVIKRFPLSRAIGSPAASSHAK